MADELTILIAEDDPGHANLIRRHIQRAGVRNEILHFEDGQAVMDFLQSPGQPRPETNYLLLLDIRMPKLDGMEVLGLLKQDEALKAIPVVMLTTTRDPDTVQQCYDLGCDNYVVKPTSVGKFAEVISQLGTLVRHIS